ncbi:DUF6265 family protein [Lutimonas saemankumensis]|uniref:DUF6265 family protein n=1 Tax=Lutimonas saemankumensis TaxID=483016 RepID=UPI001CD72336|nr:DUF6265 family protein [Lutimonas saemankumensis]MCA0932990.1 DUF6265 family protein [Lutimonas saemankumensis]
MKKTVLIIVVLFLSSFTGLQVSYDIDNQPDSFDWLLGSWERVNDPPGKRTFEYWEKSTDAVYKAMACTLKNGDTIWKERISLFRKGDDWHFEVKIKNELSGTVFKVTKIGKFNFSCENSENDFPKKIEYTLVDSGLKASISGGGDQVDFNFKKMH